MRAQPITLVGAGLAGALLAVLLARRGFHVTLYEKRRDPRLATPEAGRSINLALAARGLRALEHAGVLARVRPLMIPMRGRGIHEVSGAIHLLPYGQREHEVIYSVARAALNRVLIEEAARHAHVTLRFEHEFKGVDIEDSRAPIIATDGAGSVVRQYLLESGRIEAQEEILDHSYKELQVPAQEGQHVLDPYALHIWPRGGFMLIALPNTDGSFTATLFLPRSGSPGFAQLSDAIAVREFFQRQFPDVLPLMPNLVNEFMAHDQGLLGTVHAAPWHVGGHVLLLGDAAHAIVPFHGQGMNAAFEDCRVLDELLDQHEDWKTLFAEFERLRRPNAQAIAKMALENYIEMRDSVLDEKFLRQKALALELERRFPGRFIPRYSMVMFHPEISYTDALRRGEIQAGILEELDAAAQTNGGRVDFDRARALIEQRLAGL